MKTNRVLPILSAATLAVAATAAWAEDVVRFDFETGDLRSRAGPVGAHQVDRGIVNARLYAFLVHGVHKTISIDAGIEEGRHDMGRCRSPVVPEG